MIGDGEAADWVIGDGGDGGAAGPGEVACDV